MSNPYLRVPAHKPHTQPRIRFTGIWQRPDEDDAMRESARIGNTTLSAWVRDAIAQKLEEKSIPMGVSGAEASEEVKYRVVNLESVDDTEEFESLLNEMASQGWSLDHVEMGEMAVFRS